MPPLLRLTSNTATPKGWLRKSGEEISIFLLPPLQSMLDSWCSLESTQYRRWFSKSWGGKGPGGQVVSLGWQPGSLLLCAPPPAHISRPGLRRRLTRAPIRKQALTLSGDAETRPTELRAAVSTRGCNSPPCPPREGRAHRG